MNRRGAGVAFCCMATFLFVGRYICAAIFGSNVSSWDAELFDHMLMYIGNDLLILSVAALIIGLIYIVWAEVEK